MKVEGIDSSASPGISGISPINPKSPRSPFGSKSPRKMAQEQTSMDAAFEVFGLISQDKGMCE